MNFNDHKNACEYMGEENPEFTAWQEGPQIGTARVAYVEAHRAHAVALESGDVEEIQKAWELYCIAQNVYIEIIHIEA